MKPKTINDGTWNVEDNLLDLQAMVKFALFQIENSDEQGFAGLKNEWCTMLYLMKAKIDAAQDTAGHIGVMARAAMQAGELRH